MINWQILLKLLGHLILGISACLALPLALALITGDGGVIPLAAAIVCGVTVGGAAVLFFKTEPHEINNKEGVLFVVLAWLAAVSVGTLPYWFSPYFGGLTDAFFESMSGFTTTGATILSDIEGLPRSLHLWRALTHWLGGMGIIVLGIAILPLLGAGGTVLYKAEFSGAKSEKLKPRIAETAATLWKVYFFFTLLEYLALRFAGMTRFDAVCHAFATMATGGFSTKALSIESFSSPLIEYIIIVFMLIAGLNFALHYRFLVKRETKIFIRDSESRTYFAIALVATLGVMITLLFNSELPVEEAFRTSAFNVVSIVTCTGFTSTDYEQWVPFSQLLLLMLMFIGGCAGSTAGGLKVSRVILLYKVIAREFRRITEKRGVFSIWKDGRAIPEKIVSSLMNLVFLVIIVNFFVSLVLVATGVDIITAISATASCMFNVGPGLGDVGATDNYSHLPALAKWTLCFDMLAGRLELYTVLVIFSRSFWRK